MFSSSYFQYPPSTLHSRCGIIDCAPCAVVYFPVTVVWLSICTSSSLTSLTQSPNPVPLRQPSEIQMFCVCFCFFVLFCALDFTYKWDHMVFVFLWLILLSMMPSRSNYVVSNVKISFLLWLSNIPLYICTPAILSTHLWLGTWAASKSWLL